MVYLDVGRYPELVFAIAGRPTAYPVLRLLADGKVSQPVDTDDPPEGWTTLRTGKHIITRRLKVGKDLNSSSLVRRCWWHMQVLEVQMGYWTGWFILIGQAKVKEFLNLLFQFRQFDTCMNT